MALFVPQPEIQLIYRRLQNGNLQFINASGTPTDGVTGAGSLKHGGCYLNTATNLVYVNKGTKASPKFKVINK